MVRKRMELFRSAAQELAQPAAYSTDRNDNPFAGMSSGKDDEAQAEQRNHFCPDRHAEDQAGKPQQEDQKRGEMQNPGRHGCEKQSNPFENPEAESNGKNDDFQQELQQLHIRPPVRL